MFDACPVHPKGTMVIPMLWRISGYVVCMLGVKNQKLHIPPYLWTVPRRGVLQKLSMIYHHVYITAHKTSNFGLTPLAPWVGASRRRV
jgi:hypothetical protein